MAQKQVSMNVVLFVSNLLQSLGELIFATYTMQAIGDDTTG